MSTSSTSRAELLQRRLRGLTKARQDGITPVARAGALPLSFAQRQLWMLDQMQPDSTEYLMAVRLRLRGALDAAALRRALDELVARHEVLRTRYATLDGEPVQVIDEPGPMALRSVELRAGDAEGHLAELVTEAGALRFDLATEQPVRALLARLTDDEHVLLLTVHHIASDGWSENVLIGELDALYAAFAAGLPTPLPPLAVQYADYASWQREQLAGPGLSRQLDYWRETLAELTPLELPTDRPRAPLRSGEGATVSFTVPAPLADALVRLGRQHRATPFMVFLAAYQLLLGRYGRQHDVVVGSPVAGRDEAQTHQLIGLFTNMVVLRTDLSGGPSFVELLARVRESALGAYEHQRAPFERLVNELAPQRDPSRNPLFQVVFQLESAELEEPGGRDRPGGHDRPGSPGGPSGPGSPGSPGSPGLILAAERESVGWQVAKFDLGLALALRPDGSMVAQLEYATALFDETTAQRMVGHYLRLLASIAADPQARVSGLDLLTGEERTQLTSWSGLGHRYPIEQSLPAAFQAQVQRAPDAIAVSYEGASLSYAELDARANRLAHRLRALGVRPDSLVGVSLERGLELVVALLGVLKAGAGYLPLDPGQPAERLAYIVQDAAVTVVISEQAGGDQPARGGITTVAPTDEPGRWPDTAPSVPVDPSGVAYVIYTSGSTGKPKGVPVTHANVLRLLRSCEADFGFGPGDVWTMFHSYAFDFSVWELWGALLYGGRCVVVPFATSRSPRDFLSLLLAERVTVLNQTPSAFRGLIEAVNEAVNEAATEAVTETAAEATAEAGPAPLQLALRTVVFGGEALDVAELQPWFDRFGDASPTLVNMYGITETTVHVTYRRIHAGEATGARRSPIGRPLGDLRVYLLDEELNPVPIGVSGQLFVSGPGLARGYLGRPALTAERFGPDPYATTPGARMYRTGDLARFGPDGELEFLGRADDQVKIRGFRIEPGEIEAAITGLPEVDKSVVLAHRRPGERESRLVAYLTPRAGQSIDLAQLRERLGRLLPAYMVPAFFVPLDALPVTANGKVDRKALPEPPAQQRASHTERVAPRTPVERALAECWAEALGVPEVGVHDNFFTLGGDSIRAIRVVGALRPRGIELTVQNLLVHQSIEALARFLGNGDAVPGAAPASAEEQRIAPFALLSPSDRAKLPQGLADAYPMTMVQAAMVYQMLADRDESPYHNITLFPIADDAPFSLPALRSAAALLARRHEILRTGFDLTNYQEPLQLVHAEGEVEIEVGYDDLRPLSAEQAQQALQRFTAETRRTPFEVGRAPLLRFHAHQRGEDQWTFSFIECHAILDGWSHHSLITELMAAYRAIRDGREVAAPIEHSVRFADAVALEKRSLASPVDHEFWRAELDRFDRVELPTAWAAAPEADERPYQLTVPFRDLEPGLRKLAAAAGVPLKSVLFAAHLKVLSVLSGSERFHSGLVCNGRLETQGGEAVRGMHLNTLPLGVALTGSTWTELVAQVFAAEVAAWPHRRFPLPQLQREWGGGTPLIEVAFTYLDFHVLDRSRIESAEIVDVSPNEFALDVWTFPGVLLFTGRPERISRAGGQRLAGMYRRVLAAMAADPVGDARGTVLDERESEQLLAFAAGPEAEYPQVCLHQLFERQVDWTPQAVALRCADGTSLDYADLNARANRLARHLRSLGVGQESRVGVLLRRGPELVTALLGVLKAGAAYLPLDPSHPAPRLAALLTEASAEAVLTQSELAHLLTDHQCRTVLVDQDRRIAEQPAQNLGRTSTPDSLAYVIYTSGSTGTPKGVMVEHRNLVNYLSCAAASYAPRGGAGSPLYSSVAFDLPVTSLFPALLSGQPVTLTEDDGTPGIDALVATLERGGFGLLKLTPSHLALLNQSLSPEALPTAVSRLIVGGEELTREMLTGWARHAPDTMVHNEYGPTEATVGCAALALPVGDLEPGAMAIGRPFANTVLRVLDRNLELVPIGLVGELFIGGAQLARGYIERPELTAERFIPDPYATLPGQRLYRTGDLVRQRADGVLEYLGRADDQVKIRGYRVELGEVEAVLRRHPAVREVAVRVRTAASGDRDLVAYLVPVEGEAIEAGAVRGWLSESLPAYLVPSAYLTLGALPRTASGKVDQRALPEPSRQESRAAFVAPRTATESMLAGALAQALGVAEVGVEDEFTDLGVHSLAAMQAIVNLREAHGIAVPFRDFYQHRTVAELARAVDPGTVGGLLPTVAADPARSPVWDSAEAVLWFRRTGSKPPLFCVYPGGGQWYVQLAECLDDEQPVAALEWPGLHREVPSPQSIGSVAELFLAQVRRIQPTGPYHLLGWCGAGPVTSEMAHRLLRDGERVTFALLDPSLDSHTRSNLWEETAMFRRGETLLEELDEAHGEAEIAVLQGEFLKVLDYIIDDGVKLAPLPGDTFWPGRLRVWRELTQAMLGYRQRPYPGRLHLLIGDELAGGKHEVSTGQTFAAYLERWGELAPGGLEIHRVGGDHLGVLRPPHVAELAKLLTRLMEADR
ncbi:non-ribosomal peptide synthetase [Kitasatospora kifunensis]|uniref:Amino acid adenylation domain-containing protein n=1 Tax=Kitasatospora kifunensis TaxID=58351 RepID=A0A7W7R8G5_KITKI|nr:non-ribosomal peptide synthetase [Kitasatospora kifunensis]MBB4927264.1 amino acid adenylation domain-containing protein [Kitasatospora kifunensis]